MQQRWKPVFSNNRGNDIPFLLPYSIGHKDQPVQYGGGTTQGCEYQDAWSIVGYLGGFQAPYLTKEKKPLSYLEVHNKALELDLFLHS